MMLFLKALILSAAITDSLWAVYYALDIPWLYFVDGIHDWKFFSELISNAASVLPLTLILYASFRWAKSISYRHQQHKQNPFSA